MNFSNLDWDDPLDIQNEPLPLTWNTYWLSNGKRIELGRNPNGTIEINKSLSGWWPDK